MTKRQSRATALMIGMSAALALAVSGIVVFAITDDSILPGEDSEWIDRFVDPVRDDEEATTLEMRDYSSTFGGDGPAHTLVLYDRSSAARPGAELDALAAANLATHFGRVTISTVDQYVEAQLDAFDALIYLGSNYSETIPAALVEDVRAGDTPVLWAGANLQDLAGEQGSPAAAEFTATYGWDASASSINATDEVTTIRYNGSDLVRDERIVDGLVLPAITDLDKVEILGTALCGSADHAAACEGADGSEFPWAIRSANLTYVGEVPFDFLDEDSRYLAFADLYYDLLAPETEAVRAAAVRIEDVGPESDPADLRRVADFLSSRGIPFQVAVVPVHIAAVPDSDPVRFYGISLLDAPDIVEALLYMQERGGDLIQHGTTHQFGTTNNPYSGATGADFEFYRAHCSSSSPGAPVEIEPCVQGSWVRLTGPVSRDTVQDHVARLEAGRQVMIDAGLGDPAVFEVPHYAASPNAYDAIDSAYVARYGRSQYFDGMLTGEPYSGHPPFTQFFPYRVHDIYGTTVLPENLGNISEAPQNNHPARSAALLVDNARHNLVVRESTASFFFHPFLDTAYLDEVVTGIEELGYTFVPADQLP